jgi:hypothetical protein
MKVGHFYTGGAGAPAATGGHLYTALYTRILENCIEEFEVSEILKEEYTGEVFCGYENINHDFHVLENIFLTGKQDWKTALVNVKGIYLIMDKRNGKKYVGSAYGDSGIWSRWNCYIGNGHGHNDELTKIIKQNGKSTLENTSSFHCLNINSRTLMTKR